MKILHIVPTYIPAYRYGGPIKTVHELNKWLVKNGIEVVVYTTNIDGKDNLNVPLGQEVFIDGVKVFYFPVSFRPWQYSYQLCKALAKNIKDFDLIHITSVFLSVSTLGAYYARKFKKPYMISPRGSLMIEPFEKKRLKKWLYMNLVEKRNLKQASAVHFTTEMEREEYLKLGLPLKKGFIAANGFDLGEFNKDAPIEVFREKYNIKVNQKIILFLGRLSWKKGLDTLIPAFAEVVKKEPKVILIIAGGDDEGYKKEILKIIAEINQRTPDILRTSDVPNIVFTGMLFSEDKIAAYQGSDVFVLPSYSENFGMAPIEAMYFGLPIIISDKVGIAPIVLRENAGVVVKKDKTELANALIKILSDFEFSVKLGQNGKQLIEKEFSWQIIAENFIKVYNELIKTKLL